MTIFIQKISESGGQYRVTLPKELIKSIGFEKARVIEIWRNKDNTIVMRGYHAKKRPKNRVSGHRAKTD